MRIPRSTRRFPGVAAATAATLFALSFAAPTAVPASVVRPTPVPDLAPAAFSAGSVRLGLSKVVGGLSRPVAIANAGDGSGRLFVLEQAGRIRIVKQGVLLATPFLDIRSKVSCCGERGLLGLAFHPSFATNGKFYVYYTNLSGNIQVSEYRASSTSPDQAVATERKVLWIKHSTYSNHNGGQLAFGPDGYLYIGTGDGGGAGDPLRSGQSRKTLLGKILRIDVNGTSGMRPTGSRARTRTRGTTYRREIWAYGLRNPWRFSFDRSTGDLWIGDVGQDRYEEVDRARHSSGGGRGVNYGWSVMEANRCYRPSSGCSTAGEGAAAGGLYSTRWAARSPAGMSTAARPTRCCRAATSSATTARAGSGHSWRPAARPRTRP